ncbi:MAG: M14 family zinc carboxypeptidase [Zetaproteobacteria bacterium]|nr:M14 family zinc carboxypeptidase [Zetaproteobacteria bacterium]
MHYALKIRLILVFFLCTHVIPLNASVGPQIIDIDVEQLRKLKLNLPNIDLLGVDFPAGLARLRLSPQELTTLQSMDVDYKLIQKPHQPMFAAQGYLKPDEVIQKLNEAATQHSNLAEYKEIGRTTENRPIGALKITSSAAHHTPKPRVLFNCMHHAREVMTTEVCMDIVEQLLNQYTIHPEVTHWLNNLEVWVVPQVNPDGNARVHQQDLYWRKNTWTRYGHVQGVDLNRNYPEGWNSCNGSSDLFISQTYRGPTPASEPETQAMIDLVASIKPTANISYHSFSEIILFPYGCKGRHNPAKDLFISIAELMQQEIIDDKGQAGTYRLGTAPELLYNADGTDLDFQFKAHHVLAYTIEINSRDNGFHPNYQQWRDLTVRRQRGGWQALLERVSKEAIRVVFTTRSRVYYRLYQQKRGVQVLWDGGNTQAPYQTLAPDGALHLPVEQGNYTLNYYIPTQGIYKFISVPISKNLEDWLVIHTND